MKTSASRFRNGCYFLGGWGATTGIGIITPLCTATPMRGILIALARLRVAYGSATPQRVLLPLNPLA